MYGLLLSLRLRGRVAIPEHLNYSLQSSLLQAGNSDSTQRVRYPVPPTVVSSISLDSCQIPHILFDSGVHMALQGWVLIEERLNCLDMLHIYYPTVSLVMFALGLHLWGNECQMKMYLSSHLGLCSWGAPWWLVNLLCFILQVRVSCITKTNN